MYNIFKFGQKTLKQKRGTAFGTKFAPPYSILFMAELEEEILRKVEFKKISINFLDVTVSITKGIKNFKKKKNNFMAPFYGWGSTASRLEPLRGGSLLFTTKFPEVPGTHFIDLGRMKG